MAFRPRRPMPPAQSFLFGRTERLTAPWESSSLLALAFYLHKLTRGSPPKCVGFPFQHNPQNGYPEHWHTRMHGGGVVLFAILEIGFQDANEMNRLSRFVTQCGQNHWNYWEPGVVFQCFMLPLLLCVIDWPRAGRFNLCA